MVNRESKVIQSLASRTPFLEGIQENRFRRLEIIWDDLLRNIGKHPVVDEGSVSDKQFFIHRVSTACVTVALFDLTVEQIAAPEPLFMAFRSSESMLSSAFETT
ncbi:hypothetical protein C8J56DRAFT_1063935 [Mycena floridula]|nr:hypothetical protein C8J56DRAFT_1063935 [Mycena floridula]